MPRVAVFTGVVSVGLMVALVLCLENHYRYGSRPVPIDTPLQPWVVRQSSFSIEDDRYLPGVDTQCALDGRAH